MKIVDIFPKGIYIQLEFSLEELDLLRKALNRASFHPTPDESQAIDYVIKEFYPFLNELVESQNYVPRPDDTGGEL